MPPPPRYTQGCALSSSIFRVEFKRLIRTARKGIGFEGLKKSSDFSIIRPLNEVDMNLDRREASSYSKLNLQIYLVMRSSRNKRDYLFEELVQIRKGSFRKRGSY